MKVVLLLVKKMHDPCKKAAARTNCPKGGLDI